MTTHQTVENPAFSASSSFKSKSSAKVLAESYKGIRDQDGVETLVLTVRSKHTVRMADKILGILLRGEG